MPETHLSSPPSETLCRIFDSIAGRYDLINSLLSFRLDRYWRWRAARQILKGDERTLLDLGVGTGKFLETFLGRQKWEITAGVDFSREMLRRAREKLSAASNFVQGDIHELPFANSRFDLVISSFTLRSVKDRPHFFKEIYRVLRPHGRAAFLCLTRPTHFLGRLLYAPYLKFYLPLMGSLISSNRAAYQFLSQSIQAFPAPGEIAGELRSGGFEGISISPFTFGISTLMVAGK